MNNDEFNDENFTPEYFGVSRALFINVLKILIKDGYIDGIKIVTDKCGSDIALIAPCLTLSGMEYLSENTMMKKAYKAIKGIEDIVPGL